MVLMLISYTKTVLVGVSYQLGESENDFATTGETKKEEDKKEEKKKKLKN